MKALVWSKGNETVVPDIILGHEVIGEVMEVAKAFEILENDYEVA